MPGSTPHGVGKTNAGAWYERAFAQALTDRLDCAVLLPDDDDLNPFNYLRFRPQVAMDRVGLDSDGLNEDPMRVAVHDI